MNATYKRTNKQTNEEIKQSTQNKYAEYEMWKRCQIIERIWKRLMLEKDRRDRLTYYITFGIWITKIHTMSVVCSLWPKYNGFTIHVAYKHGTTVPSKLIKKKCFFFLEWNKHTHPYINIGIRFKSIQLYTYGAFSSFSIYFSFSLIFFIFFGFFLLLLFFCFCCSSVASFSYGFISSLHSFAKLLWCPVSFYFITDHHSLAFFFFRSLFIYSFYLVRSFNHIIF